MKVIYGKKIIEETGFDKKENKSKNKDKDEKR